MNKNIFFSDIYTKTPVDTSGLEPLHESSPTSFVVFRDQGCGPEEGPSVSPAHHMPSTSSAAAVAAAAAAILSDLPDVSTRWGHESSIFSPVRDEIASFTRIAVLSNF